MASARPGVELSLPSWRDESWLLWAVMHSEELFLSHLCHVLAAPR